MLVVRKEVLPNSVLEGFFGRACFAKPWHVLLMHSLMRSCGEMLNKECMGACCVWAGAMKGGAETAEEEIHCWKEKKGGSRDEHATSSNLSVHVIQRLTCWAVQACWQAWHYNTCTALQGRARLSPWRCPAQRWPAHEWCSRLLMAGDYQELQLALACSLHPWHCAALRELSCSSMWGQHEHGHVWLF